MHSLRSDSPFRKGPKLLAVQCSAVQSARPRHMTLQRRLSIFTPHSSLTTVVTESGGRFNLQKWMQKRRKKEGRKGDHHQSILNPSGGQNEFFFSSRGSCVYLSPLPHLVSRQSAVGTLSSRVMLFVPELFMSFPKIGRYLHRDKADGYGGVTSGHGHIPRRGRRRRR